MPNLTLPVSRGVVDGQDPSLVDFTEGELQEGEGVVYEPGDPAAHKISGRSKFNSSQISSGNPVKSIKFVQFDSADDKTVSLVDTVLYSSTVADTGSFTSIRTGISSSAETLDMTKFADNAVFVDGNTAPWMMQNDNTTIPLGLQPVTTTPNVVPQTASLFGLKGLLQYWITEYDSVNDIESAFNGTVYTFDNPIGSGSVDDALITYPSTFINPSADKFRLYRSKNNGAFPIGWRLDEGVASGTYLDGDPYTSTEDGTGDARLVGFSPYNIITINGASESRDREAQTLRSITNFKGSLVGVAGRSYYWTPAGLPHSWPVSFTNALRPLYGGQARCVREVNRVALVFFDNDTFRLNYLPNAADSFFAPGEAQEHISTHGTPSPNGAVLFSPDGYPDMLFFASRANPMITDGNATSRAVKSINWTGHVSRANLDKCVCVNNPDKYRVEMYYPLADTTQWRCFHFYYDDMRLRQGRLPKLSWTGPHRVPGPGTYAVKDGVGRVYTGNKNGESTVYYENGTSDAANLVDTNGTVNWKLRTAKMYAAGIGAEATLRRTYISKRTAGSGNYSTTHTAHREEAGTTSHTFDISATTTGLTSREFNASGQAHDIRVQRNDTASMPAVNNVTVELTDISGFEKTTTRSS